MNQETAKICKLIVTVTKNPTRAGKLRRLYKDTARLLKLSGFRVIEYHRALLFEEVKTTNLFGNTKKEAKGRLSFFKRLAWQKGANVAQWEDTHFDRLALLHLVNTHLINTLDIAFTIGEWRTADVTGGEVFDLVKAMLQHIARRKLFKRHLLHGQP